MKETGVILAEKSLIDHCVTWHEDGQEFSHFSKGHHPGDLDLLAECGALKLTLPDDERRYLVFRDGSFIFYDDGADSIMVHAAQEWSGVLKQLVEMELA